ncbi:MAG: PQQ-binding-like beta-propeller repeat protein [Anaerovoracaceae bacterium]|jgi:hypothetical protein
MDTGKRIRTAVLAAIVAVSMLVPQVSFAAAADDGDELPDQAGYTQSLWKWTFSGTSGGTWQNAVTPPALINGSIYVAAGDRVYKLDAETGEQEAKSPDLGTAPAFGYATQPVTSDSDGNIYTTTQQTENGVTTTHVVKLTSDLSSISWTSSEGITGQNISPVTYINGRIYTGTFTNTSGGTYQCIDAESGDTVWTVKNDGGFYWCGAAEVNDSQVVFGSEDGTVYSVSETADSADDIETLTLEGSIVRSTPAVSGSNVYITTKSETATANIYRLSVGDDGSLTQDAAASFGDSVNTPVICDGYVFAGNSDGEVAVFDSDLNKKASASAPASVQGEMLVSGGSGSGYSAYVTYNAKPGGIGLVKFSADLSDAEYSSLYNPLESQYCISPVISGNGVLYYKNDSNTIFAVKTGDPDRSLLKNLKAASLSYKSIRIYWTKRDNVSRYDIYRSTSKTGKYTKVKSLSGTSGLFTDTNVTCGRAYYYKVRAQLISGKYTSMTGPVSAVPVVAAPKLYAYAGTASVTLKWSKAYGASGYRVFRSTSRSGKYSCVCTTKSNTWKNSKLSRRKIYYYKVRPYRMVGKKRIYGKWSNVAYKKTK